MANTFQYVVAIDYGTSRTGYAWSVFGTSDVDKVRMCIQWPSAIPGIPKTDSAILINKEDGKMVDWGFDATKNFDPDKHYFCGRVKMDLYDPDSNRSNEFKIEVSPDEGPYRVYEGEDNKHIGRNKFFSVDLIAEVLSIMKERAINDIYETECGVHTIDNISRTIKWIITIPASATDAQKKLMRKSAIKAGLISSEEEDQEALYLVFEPEAAAVCYHSRLKNVSVFEKEHVIIIVDAGGGTVDVSALKFNPKSDKKFDQIAKSSRSDAGSTYLDAKFREYLYTIFSKEVIVAFNKEKRLLWHDLFFISNNGWEAAKRKFNHESTKIPINVQDIESFIEEKPVFQIGSVLKGLESIKIHQIMLSKELFYEEICSSVFEDASKPVKSILRDLEGNEAKCDIILCFAGGLSCSPLFVDFIQKAIGKQIKTYEGVYNIEKESAVLKGAVLIGNDPKGWIGSRISLWTYGVDCRVEFDEALHSDGRAKIETDGNKKWVNNGFITYIKKGDSIKVGVQVNSSFVPTTYSQKKMLVKILASPKKEVIYCDEDRVIELDSITLSLPGEGLDRDVDISMKFWETEVWVSVCERKNPSNKIERTVSFKWTYNKELTVDE